MYKEDLALNNPKWLTCHKSQSTHSSKYKFFHGLVDL